MRIRSPAAAIAWQLWLRHRRGAVAASATLLAMVAASPLVFRYVPIEYAMSVSLLLVVGVLGFFMNALLFVDEVGNLASGYPRRMFALPVPPRTLVIWPMLYGAAIPALAWVAMACLIYRPAGFRTPVLLPALGLSAAMAWFQALSWSPLSPSWTRLVGAVAVVGVLGGIAMGLRLMGDVSPAGLAAPAALLLAAAYPLALAGVASDRRGDLWRVWPERFRIEPGAARAGRRPFRSPDEAQRWYEWRCHGLVLPVAVGGIMLLLLAAAVVSSRAIGHRTLGSFLILILSIPIWLGTSAGPAASRMSPFWVRHRGVIPFLATRPMTSGGLVAAKFRVAARSAALTCAVTLVAAALLVVAEGRAGDAAGLWDALRARFPGWRAAAVLALGIVLTPALMWKQLTDFAPVGLTGRAWIENVAASPMVMVLLAGILAAIRFQAHPEEMTRFLDALPWLVAIVVAIKITIAAWAFLAAMQRGLVAGRDLAGFLAIWFVLVACAVGLAALTLPAGMPPASRVAAMLGIAAFMPLSRFALSPLALDWNRHR
jgi:hypothetical protein